MRVPARYWVPALLASLLILGIGAALFMETKTAIALIEKAANAVKTRGSSLIAPLVPETQAPPLEEDAEALQLLRQGEMFLLQGELAKAEEKFALSVEAEGGIPAMRKLIAVQLQRRNYKEARRTLDRLQKEGLSNSDVQLLSGLITLREGNVGSARDTFQGISTSAQGQYGLALVAIATADHDRAKELLTQAAQGSEPVLRTNARALLGAYEEFALFPDGQSIHRDTLVARALASIQECEIGLPLVSNAVSSQADYRDAWIVKGFCELTSERLNEALASLEQAYNIDPEKPETQYFLARTYFLLGDPQNAVTFLQYAVLNGFEPESDARLLLARYATELGNTKLALDQYRALTEKNTSDLIAFQKFVDLGLTLPDFTEESYQIAKLASTRWPQDPAAQILLARTEMATNRQDDAKKRLNDVLNANPTNADARALLDQMK